MGSRAAFVGQGNCSCLSPPWRGSGLAAGADANCIRKEVGGNRADSDPWFKNP